MDYEARSGRPVPAVTEDRGTVLREEWLPKKGVDDVGRNLAV